MTLQELSHHFQLREQLARHEQLLEALQSASCPGAHRITGMPHNPHITNKVGELSVEIAEMKAEIKRLQIAIELEDKRVDAFIESVEGVQMRTILRLRFIRCFQWRDVAVLIGGKNTEESVKTACYRFLRSLKILEKVR